MRVERLARLTACVGLDYCVFMVQINADDVTSSSWTSVWGSNDVKRNAFYESKQFETELAAVDGAAEVLKTLRKFFSLLAITDRPRFVEKQTREWLDHHFAGVFDKLIFVDEENSERVVARKKELCDELKVKIAVGSDAARWTEVVKNVGHVVVVGSLPWMKAAVESQSSVVQVDNWSATKEVFGRLIEELDLRPLDKVTVGPRLARYTDDLVTVSTRKPAGKLHTPTYNLLLPVLTGTSGDLQYSTLTSLTQSSRCRSRRPVDCRRLRRPSRRLCRWRKFCACKTTRPRPKLQRDTR